MKETNCISLCGTLSASPIFMKIKSQRRNELSSAGLPMMDTRTLLCGKSIRPISNHAHQMCITPLGLSTQRYTIYMQKHVNFVDLVKSFPTNIFLQNLASIQPRTSAGTSEQMISLFVMLCIVKVSVTEKGPYTLCRFRNIMEND